MGIGFAHRRQSSTVATPPGRGWSEPAAQLAWMTAVATWLAR
ncbi:hypothetical protein Acaty_c1183 [Acidithiobacillus caldus ATCC 51756]|uniref:Uncharacterized protein n=1 Tax=Acidithiobacillus caldus (strain ATCC 51756 / DSM 8584 / KU) TaxID=637389 RepID=A0A059ZYH5_ACICK|nr:hypothetical protein Acaty_c1183 [Acidithiobacillus caldus ATCC 51756]